ncbi:hypothetical protein PFISCL1PPCAC_14773, partial [Pristionchus fissidentatus]
FFCSIECQQQVAVVNGMRSVRCIFCRNTVDDLTWYDRKANTVVKYLDKIEHVFTCSICHGLHATANESFSNRCNWCALETRDVYVHTD